MIETLRPATLGEILDRTTHIYRTRFLVFLGIAFMPTGVILACAVAFGLVFAWVNSLTKTTDPAVIGMYLVLFFLAGSVVLLPVGAAALGLGSGALNHAAAAAFENRTITIRGAYRAAWKRGWRYIGLLVLEGLILVVAPGIVWSMAIGVFAMGQILSGKASSASNPAGGAVVLLLFGLLCLYALWMLLLLCFAFPASVVEDVGPGAALKRALFLSKGTRGRLLVIYLLGTALRWGVSFVLFIPIVVLVTIIPGANAPQYAGLLYTVLMLAIYGGGFLIRAVTKPIYTIAQMLFYFDQRIRKEGYDIEWMMRQAGMVAEPLPAPAPWMPPPYPNEATSQALSQPVAGPVAAPTVEHTFAPEPDAVGDSAAIAPAPGEPA